ncbi:MAG: hypothetical protein WBB28_01320 [Crinalium sp.]
MASHLEEQFDLLWRNFYPTIILERQFSSVDNWIYDWEERRKISPHAKIFVADFAHKQSKILIEISGQIWRKGAHNTGKGLLRDYRKNNLALMSGWRTFVLAPEMIADNFWLDAIAQTIKGNSVKPQKISTRAGWNKKIITSPSCLKKKS